MIIQDHQKYIQINCFGKTNKWKIEWHKQSLMQHMQPCIIEQTEITFIIRIKHFRYVECNESQSFHSLNVLNKRHEYGPQEETMQLFKTCKRANT